MLKLNKKTEYAFLAIEQISKKEASGGELTSTREISKTCNVPYPIMAKVTQRLASKGIIKSVHGTKGGYVLAKRPENISVADIIEAFDGKFAMTDCFKGEKITCPQWRDCMLKTPLYALNQKIHSLLTGTAVADLLEG